MSIYFHLEVNSLTLKRFYNGNEEVVAISNFNIITNTIIPFSIFSAFLLPNEFNERKVFRSAMMFMHIKSLLATFMKLLHTERLNGKFRKQIDLVKSIAIPKYYLFRYLLRDYDIVEFQLDEDGNESNVVSKFVLNFGNDDDNAANISDVGIIDKEMKLKSVDVDPLKVVILRNEFMNKYKYSGVFSNNAFEDEMDKIHRKFNVPLDPNGFTLSIALTLNNMDEMVSFGDLFHKITSFDDNTSYKLFKKISPKYLIQLMKEVYSH